MKHLRRSSGPIVMALLLTMLIQWQPTATAIVLAQSSKGAVAGTVSDPTGALIGGAAIKITNTSTNITHKTITTADGTFRIDAVDPGAYRVEVSVNGFKSVERKGVVIAAAQTTDASFMLERSEEH